MTLTYRAAPGASISQAKAQEVGQFLETLGEFTPKDVVNAARPENSPIHSEFTWNDFEAAEKHRLNEARHLVNRITVVVKVGDKETETRAFHSITVQDSEERVEQRYTHVRVVAKNEVMREQVIANAMRELEGWQKRYDDYSQLIGPTLFEEIKKTIKRTRVRTNQPVAQAS